MKATTSKKSSHAVRHAHAVDPGMKQKALVRLRRIEGQVRGVQKMIEDERYCADVLVQISAIHESLRSVATLLLRNHLQHCATEALKSGDPEKQTAMYDELTELFAKHVR